MCLSALEVCHSLPCLFLSLLSCPSRPCHQEEPELDTGFLPGPCSLAVCRPWLYPLPCCHHFKPEAFFLQLALQHTPPLSDIFVFTDASPKDAFLTNRVESLTREKRCRVSAVLITGKESCLMEGGPTSLTYSRVGGRALSKTRLRILNRSSKPFEEPVGRKGLRRYQGGQKQVQQEGSGVSSDF